MDSVKHFIKTFERVGVDEDVENSVKFYENMLFNDNSLLNDSDLNYSLESDPNFDNVQKQNISEKYYCDEEHSLPINFDVLTEEFRQNGVFLSSSSNYLKNSVIKEPFIRLTLNGGMIQEDVINLLKIVADCNITFLLGGATVYNIPAIILSMIFNKTFGYDITIYKPKEFIETEGLDELKKKIMLEKNNLWVLKSDKYLYYDINDTYLDIPIIGNMFFYGEGVNVSSLLYVEKQYKFIVPKNKISAFQKYVKNITVCHNKLYFYTQKLTNAINENRAQYSILDSQTYYFNNMIKQSNVIEIYGRFSKFMFFVIRSANEFSGGLNSDEFDVTQLPIIERLEGVTLDGMRITWNKENFIITDYLNFRVIGVACDFDQNMNNWVEYVKDCDDLMTMNKKLLNRPVEQFNPKSYSIGNFDDNKYLSFDKLSILSSELDLNDSEIGLKLSRSIYSDVPKKSSIDKVIQNVSDNEAKYKSLRLNNVTFYLSDYTVPIDIQVFTLKENSLKCSHGMAGKTYV